jgi:hypothetical protein
MTSNQDESSFVFSKMDQNIVYQQNEQNTVIRWDWQIDPENEKQNKGISLAAKGLRHICYHEQVD